MIAFLEGAPICHSFEQDKVRVTKNEAHIRAIQGIIGSLQRRIATKHGFIEVPLR